MWAVTGWAIRVWLRITVFLALGVGAAWLWLSPGWLAVVCIAAGLIEMWAFRQLAREWAWEARSSWWWST